MAMSAAATDGTGPATMFEKIWRRHVVVDRPDGYTLLYVDRHLLHDGSYNAFKRLEAAGMKVRRPDRAFATPDHYMPTNTRDKSAIVDPNHRRMVVGLAANAAATGVTIFDIGDSRQGIVHVHRWGDRRDGRPRPHHRRHWRRPPGHRSRRRSRAQHHAPRHHARVRR